MNNSKGENKFSDKYKFDLSKELAKKEIVIAVVDVVESSSRSINSKNELIDNHTKKETSLNSEKQIQINDSNVINDLLKIMDSNKKENSYNIEIKLNNQDDVKKIKADSKTYYENLKRKIILNHRLLSVFIENFYRDEFNNSRTCSYLIFTLPTSALLFFKMVSPYHPFLSIIFNVTLFGSLISFGYSFNQEMSRVAHLEYSDIGKQIRSIKNELVMYNPLSKPVLEDELVNKENKKI